MRATTENFLADMLLL